MKSAKQINSRITLNVIVWSLVLFVILISSDAKAVASCASVVGSKPIFQRLTNDLTPAQLQMLKDHPISKYADGLKLGQGLEFRSMFYNVEASPRYKGEYVQSQYIRKVLESLFPKAKFSHTDVPTLRGREPVKILLADIAERSDGFVIKKIANKGMILPMHIVKPSNYTPVKMDKTAARQELGLPANRKIISLYVRSEDTMTNLKSIHGKVNSKFTELFEGLEKAFPLDIVIITFGNYSPGVWGLASTGLLHSGVTWNTTAELSEIMTNKSSFDGQTIIVNDTQGKMKSIYAAADLAVVVGPINFFEPLTVGTPTLLVEKSSAETQNSSYDSYDDNVYNSLMDLAIKTGGAAKVTYDRFDENWNDGIPAAVKKIMKSKKPFKDISPLTFPAFLDALYKHVKYQLEEFDPKDFDGTGISFK